jgi:fructose-specific phosphotransferase system IIC component
MRYLMAMAFGIAGAAATAWFFAGAVAGWFSRQFTYQSPDGQSDVEQMSFLGVLIVGMAVGWTIGWMLGAPFARRPQRD